MLERVSWVETIEFSRFLTFPGGLYVVFTWGLQELNTPEFQVL